MSFDVGRAFTGLLAEGGRQLTAEAGRLRDIEDKRLEDERRDRRETALLTKQQSLKMLGWDETGKPWTRGEYEEATDKPILKTTPEGWDEKEDKAEGKWGKDRADAIKAGMSEEEARAQADRLNAPTVKEPKPVMTKKEILDYKDSLRARYNDEFLPSFDSGEEKAWYGRVIKEGEDPPSFEEWAAKELGPEDYKLVFGRSAPKTEQKGILQAGETEKNETSSSVAPLIGELNYKPGSKKPEEKGVGLGPPEATAETTVEPEQKILKTGDKKEVTPPTELDPEGPSFATMVLDYLKSVPEERKKQLKKNKELRKIQYILRNMSPQQKKDFEALTGEQQAALLAGMVK